MKEFKTKKGAELTFTKKAPKNDESSERQASLLRQERQKQALENLRKLEHSRTQRKSVDPLASEKETIRLEVLAKAREAKKNEKNEQKKLHGDVMGAARKSQSQRSDTDEKQFKELQKEYFEHRRAHPVKQKTTDELARQLAEKEARDEKIRQMKTFKERMQKKYPSKKDDPNVKIIEFKMKKRREIMSEIDKIENKECRRAFKNAFWSGMKYMLVSIKQASENSGWKQGRQFAHKSSNYVAASPLSGLTPVDMEKLKECVNELNKLFKENGKFKEYKLFNFLMSYDNGRFASLERSNPTDLRSENPLMGAVPKLKR